MTETPVQMTVMEIAPERPRLGEEGFPLSAWTLLLSRIAAGKCTPFLGPECWSGSDDICAKIAMDWSSDSHFPFEDHDNLARVAQHLSFRDDERGANYWKEELARKLATVPPPDFSDRDEPHRILANLPIPVYINTHFTSFMMDALNANPMRSAREAICRWDDRQSTADNLSGFEPKPATPLVYHLFGHINEPTSLVLTEDDHLDYLVSTSADRQNEIIPRQVSAAMKNHTLLFLGYQMSDLSFRVLLRRVNQLWLGQRPDNKHFSVQMVHVGPKASQEQLDLLKKHMNTYFTNGTYAKIVGYWGSTHEFLVELRQRMEG